MLGEVSRGHTRQSLVAMVRHFKDFSPYLKRNNIPLKSSEQKGGGVEVEEW